MEESEEGPEENPKGGPDMGQEVGPKVEPEEYVVTDYEYGESNQELDEGNDVEEACSEPHLSKAPSDPRTVLKSDTDHLRSLEEEITNLKRQIFAGKERVVQVEKRVKVITQEANKLVELQIRQLDD
ncbi:unnamed protein product [Lactuca saligna]|uniref:Uncharacterized protein n=1 Tax=Lactuca saligna TaxID=75948 RepID=A0AA35ZVN5_LACSI|nr:unnamed protein product [Lactuca saligna]